MYTRFFRWASDRLHDDGVLALVTNRSFVESRTFDGFRKVTAKEFNEIYVVDLGGDIRVNPKLSGTRNNVFGIQTGVAISFFVKRRKQTGNKIFYLRRPEFDTAEDKLAFLGNSSISSLNFQRVEPDTKHNWLNLSESNWDSLLPLADKASKAAKNDKQARSLFWLYSRGLGTFRDEWMYDFNAKSLATRIRYMISIYEKARNDWNTPDRDRIKWDRELEKYRSTGVKKQFDVQKITKANYRTFIFENLYFDRHFIGMTYQIQSIFPPESQNLALTIMGDSSGKPFFVFAIDKVPDLNFVSPASGGTQTFARYRYTPEGERIDNITDWALKQFREHYKGAPPSPLAGEGPAGDEGGGADTPHPAASRPPSPARGEGKARAGEGKAITKDAIFHYVYGVLHDPIYRETYAQNLKREFPRLPFYPDFWRWAGWGERLMALHIGYESVEPWPLTLLDVPDEKARAASVTPRVVLKADRDAGIITLDSETQLTGVPKAAWDYRLGNRSGLDWILDQYKEKTPKDPTIREKFNTYRFADYKETVVDLLMRVARVSVETVAITEAMRALKR